MAGSNVYANDQMIRRLETELKEHEIFANGLIERANAGERDLNDDERELLCEKRARMSNIKDQIEQLEDISRVADEVRNRAAQVDRVMTSRVQQQVAGPVEYRSAGAWALDTYKSHLGDREASERLELFHRAAEHQKTPDNLGIIPDPVVGGIINFIDAARPLVSLLGPRPLPGATWHRPRVTQHTAVAKQGVNGALGVDEKTELESQKMIIDRLTAVATTYGGYVNVSRQNIDFSQPSIMDIIINDLAAQYAIETEAATAALVSGTSTSGVGYDVSGPNPGQSLATAVWSAAAQAYSAVKGQGRLVLVVAPDVLGLFGPLFATVNPQNAFGGGFSAGSFGQGQNGNVSGLSVTMSAGLGAGEAFMLSTAAVEVYEQRIGTLQVTEPSVLGVQVAYAGYFTPLLIAEEAIIPLTGAGT